MIHCIYMHSKTIEPYSVYNTEEVCNILEMDEKSLYREINKGLLVAKKAGKGWKILGENLLSFLGSPSISRMQPNRYTGGVPTQEEAKNSNTDYLERVGAVTEK